MKVLKLNIQSNNHRRAVIETFIDNGYKVWVEEEGVEDFIQMGCMKLPSWSVCVELKDYPITEGGQ